MAKKKTNYKNVLSKLNEGEKSYKNRFNIGQTTTGKKLTPTGKTIKNATKKSWKSIGKALGLDWN